MQGGAGGIVGGAAGVEIDRVVVVAAIRRTSPRRNQTALPQQPQVIRHEILRFVDELYQLSDRPITPHELLQQPPAHWMGSEAQERGWIDVVRVHRRHIENVTDIDD